jgi:hypothetical protein
MLILSAGQQSCLGHPFSVKGGCLVQLEIARDAPHVLGFAIYIWTIPAQVVQTHIAISVARPLGGEVVPNSRSMFRGDAQACPNTCARLGRTRYSNRTSPPSGSRKRIRGLAEIALTQDIYRLGGHVPIDGIVFVDDLDHHALNGHPVIGIDRIHKQQRHVAPKSEIPVFLAAAHRIQQNIGFIAANPHRANVYRSVAVDA